MSIPKDIAPKDIELKMPDKYPIFQCTALRSFTFSKRKSFILLYVGSFMPRLVTEPEV